MSILPEPGAAAGAGALTAFRAGFYDSLTARVDALFELTEALLCQNGPVTSLPALSLAGAFRRGHGALKRAQRRLVIGNRHGVGHVVNVFAASTVDPDTAISLR